MWNIARVRALVTAQYHKNWATFVSALNLIRFQNQDFIVIEIDKIAPNVSITALPVSRELVELGSLSRIGRNKFERFLIVFRHWTMTVAPRSLIFNICKDKYTSLITDSINCRNCSFSHFADSGSRSPSEIWRVAYCFGTLNRNILTKIYAISHIQRKIISF